VTVRVCVCARARILSSLPLRHDHIVLGAQNNNEKSDAEKRGRSTSPVSLYRKLSPRRLSPTGRLSPVALRKMIGASGSNVPEGRELQKEESQNLSFASSDSGSNDYRIHHQFATQFIAAAANNSATWGETFNIVQVNPMLHFEDGFWRKTGVTAPGKQGLPLDHTACFCPPSCVRLLCMSTTRCATFLPPLPPPSSTVL